MKTVLLAVLVIAIIPLLAGSAVAKAISNLIGGADHKDTAFMVVLFGAVMGLLKVLWEAHAKNHNPLRLYIAIFGVLLLPLILIISMQDTAFVDRAKASYIVITVIIAVSLPWILTDPGATFDHQTFWWTLSVITIGVSAAVFGIYHLGIIELKNVLLQDIPHRPGTSSLLISPHAAGMAATSWAVMQYSTLHHQERCHTLTLDTSHWIRTYMVTAVLLTTTYGCLFAPSLLRTVDMMYIDYLRSAAICTILLLAPIISIAIYTSIMAKAPTRSWIIFLVLGLAVGIVCAAFATILTAGIDSIQTADKIYIIVAHGLLSFITMLVYLGIMRLMYDYPWSWVNALKNALQRQR